MLKPVPSGPVFRVLPERVDVGEWIEWEAGYLARVRARLCEVLAAGAVAEAAIEAVGFAEFVGDRLPADRHKMPSRHRNTVAAIAEEVTGAGKD